jgi:3-oxoacyl-[acyl-carrier protein] reductase
MNISGQSVLVTGAAGGLGACFVSSLLNLGANNVVAIDVDPEGLDRLAADISDARLVPKLLDIGDESAVLFLFQEIEKLSINPKILINNAGMLSDGLLASNLGGFIRKLSTANWTQSLSTNLTGHFFMAREFAVSILGGLALSETESHQTDAVIVNISSISSVGTIGQSNYAAAKAGLDASTRTWARELASDHIRVCGISPGLIMTDMLAEVAQAEREKLLREIPLGRPGRPKDIWMAVKFAIECDYFTGRVLSVDGGAIF